MKVRIFRAKAVNTLMTGVFYLIGGSFLLLIFVLAGYIIIKGIAGYYPGIMANYYQGNCRLLSGNYGF